MLRWVWAALVLPLLFSACAKAEPYSELRGPTGRYAGQAPKGYVIVLHGGAWRTDNPRAVAEMRPDADRLRRLGYATFNTTYTGGRESVESVVGQFDRLRERVGRVPICAMGSSAGGHLALMLASRRSSLRCVVGQGSPTDLARLTGARPSAVKAFGRSLDRVSPALLPEPNASVLLAHNDEDAIVPVAQARRMRGRERTQVAILDGSLQGGSGHTPWSGHFYIRSDALAHYHQLERRFLERATR